VNGEIALSSPPGADQTGAMRLLTLSGSLRASSSNAALLRAAAALLPPGATVEHYDAELVRVPPFNPDLDGEGAVPPGPVAELRGLLRAADAILIACPEYAHGAPGVLKNALDWIVSSGELEGKPVALIAASPSGGTFAQSSLTPTLEVMGARMVFNTAVTFTRKMVDPQGKILDPKVLAALAGAVAALAA
jgi:chromate reductase